MRSQPFASRLPPLDLTRLPLRRARARLLHDRFHLRDLAWRAGDPLDAAVGDDVVVLDAHADVAVLLHRRTDLRDHRAVAWRVLDDLEQIAANVDAWLD